MRVAARFLIFIALGIAVVTWATTASAGGYNVEYAFAGNSDATAPVAGLTEYAGKLYGTTRIGGLLDSCAEGSCGAVFTFDPKTGVEKVVYAFKGGSDGASPHGGLIVVNGKLYGTTRYGGTNNCGTVFSFDPKTRAEKVVYPFKGGDDGQGPWANLILVNGSLYGTTSLGGLQDCVGTCGTVFAIDPTTGVETVVYAFKGGGDGYYPTSDLTYFNGRLYGTTTSGGLPNYDGTVFAVDPTTGAETVVHTFQGGVDGAAPMAGLLNVGGVFYGVTTGGLETCTGGGPACGTLFSLDPSTSSLTTLHVFKGAGDGYNPVGGLINDGGILYGTTANGTALKLGTVFALNPTTRVKTILHVFKGGADGSSPQASLLYWGRTLYGTTAAGGGSANCAGGCGTVFSIKP